MKPTKEDLIAALSAAANAHHNYQEVTLNGVHDEYWPGWYAAFVLGRLGDFASPSSLSKWLAGVSGDGDWSHLAAIQVLDQL